MKTARMVLLSVVCLAAALNLFASGPVGIYAVLDKVILEPNDTAPERVQLWGAFKFVYGDMTRPGNSTVSPAQSGYMYFKAPASGQQTAAKAEWADLKAVAGRGQAVGFGSWFVRTFDDVKSHADLRIRPASESPANPGNYLTNTGVIKLADSGSHADIVRELKEALRAR